MTALITGASAGIGAELAREFAKDKINLILVARRERSLKTLAAELSAEYNINVSVIALDLSLSSSAAELYKKVQSLRLTVDYLVNNAGFGDLGEFADSDIQKQEDMVNLNILTLTKLTRLYAAEMKTRKLGTILNVASDAAFRPGPMMSVYFATKHFVLAFSEAIAEELRPYNVHVSILCPGATQSEFGEVAGFGPPQENSPFPTSKEVAEFGYLQMQKREVVSVHGGDNRNRIEAEKSMSRQQIRETVYLQMSGLI
ncbi:MAG: short-subunit dehydrogenase [Bacteroidia bacterium]|jgi:short-subunit dehydrogenase